MIKRSHIALFIFLASMELLYSNELATNHQESEQQNVQTKVDTIVTFSPKIEPYRPPTFTMSERTLQWQLRKLVFMANKTYPRAYGTTEMLFEEMNRLPDEVKINMLKLVMAGGVAKEAMRYARKLLNKHKMGFIIPNLSGLNIHYPLTKIHSKFSARIAGPSDYYLSLSTHNSLIIGGYHSTAYYVTKSLNFKFIKRFRLIYQDTAYHYTRYKALGISRYSKNHSLYFIYLKNQQRQDWNRAYIQWRLSL